MTDRAPAHISAPREKGLIVAMKRLRRVFLCLLTAWLTVMPCLALRETESYVYDDWGKSRPAPTAYRAVCELDGRQLGTTPLNGPQDLFVAADGRIYVADTGNDRVLILDDQLHFVREIRTIDSPDGNGSFNQPQGVYAADGLLYVCDTDNGRIVALDREDRVVWQLTRPVTALIDPDIPFKPTKVTVDSLGYVYAVCFGLYQGLATYAPDHSFAGFFGSNRIEATLSVRLTYMWKQLFSKQQAESMIRLIPTEYSNLVMDANDFLYTSVASSENSLQEIKKLNASGINVLRIPAYNALYSKDDYGDVEKEWIKGRLQDSRLVDIHVDALGIMAVLDVTRGHIFGYDPESNLLFTFGNIGNQSGCFLVPTALDKASDRYLVLDGGKNTVTVFAPTDYTTRMREAVAHYHRGEYVQSIAEWQAILDQNAFCSLAYRGIGKAYLQQREYAAAMCYLKKGNDRTGYSLALAGYRKGFIREHVVALLLGTAVSLTAVIWAGRRVLRRLKRKERDRS